MNCLVTLHGDSFRDVKVPDGVGEQKGTEKAEPGKRPFAFPLGFAAKP